MAVDINAMYKAGLARGSTGRNPKVERQIARRQRLVDFGYSLVGTVATEMIKDSFEGMQKFRDAKESQTAAMNLAQTKVPKENTNLPEAIRTINANYRDAARRSRLTFGEKRREAKAEMQMWMGQMRDMNSYLEAYQFHTPKSQGRLSVATGIAGENNKGGNSNISSYANPDEIRNLTEQANGDMGMLLNWDLDNGTMKVYRGGKWITDENGKRSYKSKGIEENKELKKKYNTYKKKIESQQLDSPLNMPEGETSMPILSYQEWAESQNVETLRNVEYSKLKFPKPEDRQMAEDYNSELSKNTTLAYKRDSLPWDLISEDNKTEFNNRIDGYSDSTFKDFFFGGGAFDHSNRRMPESSLAYKLLLSRNFDNDTENDLIPPGSENSTEQSDIKWEGALTTLKMQSMVSGSSYRKYAKETLWKDMEDRYTKAQQRWADDHPDDSGGSGRGGNYTTINLPWQKNIKEGQNQREIGQQTLVDGVLAGRDRVVAGNDIYTKRVNGRDYQLTGEIVQGTERPISSGSIVTGRSLVETRGGRFGKIPADFDFDPIYKPRTSPTASSQTRKYDPLGKQITIKQMKDALKGSGGPYNLNAPDKQIRKMYKKWFLSRGKQD